MSERAEWPAATLGVLTEKDFQPPVKCSTEHVSAIFAPSKNLDQDGVDAAAFEGLDVGEGLV